MEPMTVTTAAILGGTAFGGSLLNALIVRKGAKEQVAESKVIRAFERETFGKTFAEEKRATRVAEKISKEKLALEKSKIDFDKRQTFIDNFLTNINLNPGAGNNFIELSRARR